MREGWCKKALSDVATIYNGNSINAEEKKKKYLGQTQGLPFIATKDVGNDGSIDYENGVRIPNYIDFKIAYPDSVFVCAEGGSAGKKVAFVEKEVCFGNKLFALQPKKALLNGKYLYYFVQSQSFKEQFKQLITGIIGGVSSKKFKEIPIILSSLPEQQRIVDILDQEFAKIDALKANAEKSLQAAKDLFQATLKKELEPKEGWTILPLSGIVDEGSHISYGIVQPGDDFPGGVPVVRPVDLTSPVLRSTSTFKRTRPEISQAYKRSILTGKEILLCVRGTTGVLSLSSGALKGCNTTRGIVPLCVADDTKRQFVYYALLSPACQKFIAEYTNGTALKQINIADVKNIPVPVAPKKEQEKVVSILDELTRSSKKLQENYQKTLTLCDDLKQSLLRKAFIGEL